MEADISSMAQLLQTTGPYGLLVVLGWAFWRVNTKKDQTIRELYDKAADLSTQQTAALNKVEVTLTLLRDSLQRLEGGPRTSLEPFPQVLE